MSNKDLIRAQGVEFSYGDQMILSFEDFELYNNECTNNTGCTNTAVQCGEKPPTS